MPIQSRYLFSAAMDVDVHKDALFNEVYDTEHVPLLSRVPGVISIARFKRRELTMVIGGKRQTIVLMADCLLARRGAAPFSWGRGDLVYAGTARATSLPCAPRTPGISGRCSSSCGPEKRGGAPAARLR